MSTSQIELPQWRGLRFRKREERESTESSSSSSEETKESTFSKLSVSVCDAEHPSRRDDPRLKVIVTLKRNQTWRRELQRVGKADRGKSAEWKFNNLSVCAGDEICVAIYHSSIVRLKKDFLLGRQSIEICDGQSLTKGHSRLVAFGKTHGTIKFDLSLPSTDHRKLRNEAIAAAMSAVDRMPDEQQLEHPWFENINGYIVPTQELSNSDERLWLSVFGVLSRVVEVVDGVVDVNPLLKSGWKLLSSVYKSFHNQVEQDSKMRDLMKAVRFSLSFVDDARFLERLGSLREMTESDSKRGAKIDTVVELAKIIEEAARISERYCEKTFKSRIMHNVVSSNLAESITDIIDRLGKAQQQIFQTLALDVWNMTRNQNQTLDEIKGELVKLSDKFAIESAPHPSQFPTARCLGRDEDISSILVALGKGDPIALLGCGGIGKSTVAIKTVKTFRQDDNKLRRIFCRCDGASSREAVVTELSKALGTKVGSGDIEAQVLSDLRRVPTVLVLDNFETPLQRQTFEVESLLSNIAETMLKSKDNLKLIITMRGSSPPPLRIDKEFPWTSIDLSPLDTAFSEQLFLATIHGSGGRQDVETGNSTVGEILQDLDGHPLSIELFGRVVSQSQRPLQFWVDRWRKQRIDMLKYGSESTNTSLKRSLSLSLEAINQSDDDSAEQLLRVLGMLPDGLPVDELNTIFPDFDFSFASDTLVGVSLAFLVPGTPEHPGYRLRQLAPIREFSRAVPPHQKPYEIICRHYLDFAITQGERFRVEDATRTLLQNILTNNLANMTAIIKTALKDSDSWLVATAITSLIALRCFFEWTTSGPIELLEAAANRSSSTSEKGRLHRASGISLRKRGYYYQSETYFARALAAFQSYGDGRDCLNDQACCLHDLATIALTRGHYDEAKRQYHIALEMHKEDGDISGQAQCFKGLGAVAFLLEGYKASKKARLEALRLFRQAEDRIGEAGALQQLGLLAKRQKLYEEADVRFNEALSLFKETGYPSGQALCLLYLGDSAVHRGFNDEAEEYLHDALTRYKELHELFRQAEATRLLGWVALNRDQEENAKRFCFQACEMFQQIEDISEEIQCYVLLSDIAQHFEKNDEVEFWEEKIKSLNGYEISQKQRRGWRGLIQQLNLFGIFSRSRVVRNETL